MRGRKVYIPCDSKMSIGGAWTAKRNIESVLNIVQTPDEADISLIMGATMITRDTFKECKAKTKIVLRLDGVPEDWRNRGAGWSRLRDFYHDADGVIVQSSFIANTVSRWLLIKTGNKNKALCQTIYNGLDKSIFTSKRVDGEPKQRKGQRRILCVGSRKDANKRLEEVIERYRYYKLDTPDSRLSFVGVFPTEIKEQQFGLYDMEQNKDWQYLGIVNDQRKMAEIMRGHHELWFPSFADPSPNFLLEALHCGLKPKYISDYGGAKELVNMFNEGYDFSLEKMGKEYNEFLNNI